MAFSTNCTSKGCYKNMEPYIDPKTDKVYCSICDSEILNITYFTKSQMKSSKQYRKKSGKPFATKCPHCSKEEQPKIINDDIVCGACQKPLDNLTSIFKNMLKEKLKTTGNDVE